MFIHQLMERSAFLLGPCQTNPPTPHPSTRGLWPSALGRGQHLLGGTLAPRPAWTPAQAVLTGGAVSHNSRLTVGFEAATSRRRCGWCMRRKGQKAADGVIAPLNRVVEEHGPDGSAVLHSTHTPTSQTVLANSTPSARPNGANRCSPVSLRLHPNQQQKLL